MVTLGSKRIHVALADSRGGDLQQYVKKHNNTGEYLEIKEYKEATLEDLLSDIERYLPLHQFDVIYLAGGGGGGGERHHYQKQMHRKDLI